MHSAEWPPRQIARQIALALLFAILVAEGVYFLVYGRFNIDEGIHLNAGSLLFEQGRLPYRDFPFSQGPGGPLFYGIAGTLFGTSLLVGRSLSLLLNLLGVGAMMWFAGRVSGSVAAGLVALWTMVNLPAVWTFAQIRTEPPSIPLVVFAAIALCVRKGSVLRWALAPSLLVWATSAHLTTGLPLLAVCGWVAFELRRSPRTLLAVAAIVMLNGLLAALPMLVFPQESFFHIVSSQLGRTERLGMADFPFTTRFWFFLDDHTSFRPLLYLGCVPLFVILRHWRRGWRPRGPSVGDPASILTWLVALALLSYLPYIFMRIGFFHYFVISSVLLTLAIAISIPILVNEWVNEWVGESKRQRAPVIALLSCLIAAVWIVNASSAWETIRKWVSPGISTISRFAELREEIHALSPGYCRMMTFETHVAVETDCEVFPGLEYSYFSLFPHISSSEAERYGVLNKSRLSERMRLDPPEFVALTWRALDFINEAPKEPAKKPKTFGGELEKLKSKRAPTDLQRRKRSGPPILDVMRGRYRLIEEMKLPVGPVHAFWTTVYLYARSDLG